MNSMAFTFMLILVAVVVIAGVYLAIRLVGGREVDSDHKADPHAARPEGFGSADREQAREAERHQKPNDAE